MTYPWQSRKVLVTGGASFIGSTLVDALLARGADVRVVDDFSSGVMSNIQHVVDAGRWASAKELGWATFAAVDAHIPLRYRAAIKQELLESIQNEWWNTGRLGAGTWVEYHTELNERQRRYANLVDQEGISHMGVCAETASLMEDQGLVSSENREKLLVLLIDYAPASEYGRLLEEAG